MNPEILPPNPTRTAKLISPSTCPASTPPTPPSSSKPHTAPPKATCASNCAPSSAFQSRKGRIKKLGLRIESSDSAKENGAKDCVDGNFTRHYRQRRTPHRTRRRHRRRSSSGIKLARRTRRHRTQPRNPAPPAMDLNPHPTRRPLRNRPLRRRRLAAQLLNVLKRLSVDAPS